MEMRHFEHAWQQAAAAIALDPLHESNHRLFNELLERDSRALEHLRVSDGTFFGIAALRARVLASSGTYAEAFELLESTLLHEPARPFLPWSTDWMLPHGSLLQFGEGYFELVSESLQLSPGVVTNLTALFDMLSSRLVGIEVAELRAGTVLRIRIKRHLGEHDVACSLAQEIAAEDFWLGLVEYAICLRKLGRWSEAAHLFERAVTCDPEEKSAYLDLGDTHLMLGHFQRSAEVYTAVLERWPTDEWAQSSRLYCLALLGQVQAEATLWSRRSGTQREKHLAHHFGIYRKLLAIPFHPLTHALRRALSDVQKSPQSTLSMRFRFDGSIPSSARLAFQIGLHQLGKQVDVWVTDSMGSSQSLNFSSALRPSAPGSAELSEGARLVVDLAQSEVIPETWLTRAEELASHPSAPSERELLELTKQPPTVPHLHPMDWVFRVQVTSALVLASTLESTALDSGSRAIHELLESDDWPGAAIAVALTWWALKRTWLRPTVDDWLSARLDNPARTSSGSNAYVLLVCLTQLRSGAQDLSETWVRRIRFEQENRLPGL